MDAQTVVQYKVSSCNLININDTYTPSTRTCIRDVYSGVYISLRN